MSNILGYMRYFSLFANKKQEEKSPGRMSVITIVCSSKHFDRICFTHKNSSNYHFVSSITKQIAFLIAFRSPTISHLSHISSSSFTRRRHSSVVKLINSVSIGAFFLCDWREHARISTRVLLFHENA